MTSSDDLTGSSPSVTPARLTPVTLRYVRVLRALGLSVESTAAVTGCPPGRVAATTVDTATLRDDLTLITLVDQARVLDTTAPAVADVEAAARLLADASGSPRYGADGIGWSGLIGSEANIEHAARAALARLGGAWGQAELDQISNARTLLLRHATGVADARE